MNGSPPEQFQPFKVSDKPLETYGRNLTPLARNGKLDPVIGRDAEIRRCMQVLSRWTKNNPVLIGEAGVGKTAIVEGLAQRMVSGDVPETLKNKELLQLDMTALVAGAAFRGEFEERLKAVLKTVDEATAALKMEVESMPAELDQLKRHILQLEIEREALKKEKDPASRERLKSLETEIETENCEL